MGINIVLNNEWEVLTPEGFKDFSGISCCRKETIILTFKSNKTLICTPDHKLFLSNGSKIEAKDSINKIISTKYGNDVVNTISNYEIMDVYDLLSVKETNSFYGNGIHISNCAFMDEVAFVSDHIWDDFFNSVLPTISSGKSSKIIMVSTPKGMNHFYKIYKDAVDDKNNFRAIKVPWWERPDRDETWKKKTLMEMGSDKIKFAQEFDCRFLGSSNTLIEADTLERIKIDEPTDNKYGGAMLIYEAPQPGCNYILGVDSAKGNGSDYSTIQVLKIVSSSEIYQVATYRNNLIAPDNFAQLAIGISTYYNKAFMMVESNDIGELVTNKIWYDYECDRLINCDRKGLGIRATRKSKLEGNLLLKKYVENGWLEIRDRRTLYELSRYEEVSPNVFHAAGQNENDDCVTSLIWALYYTTTEYFGDDGNTKSRIIDAKYRLDEADVPVFIGDTDNFSNEYTWSSY